MGLPAEAELLPPWKAKARAHFVPQFLDQLEAIPFLPFELIGEAYDVVRGEMGPEESAYLALIDRFYLVLCVLKRRDILEHGPKGTKWLYERCREVEAQPDNCLDLWAREHYKSTFITFAGIIQEILRDPEITISIFSFNNKEAKKPHAQVMREMEDNAELKALYPHILWQNPKTEAPKWSATEGIIVRRKTNPKNATLECHGLVDGMPTGSHYRLRVYDDVVTRESTTTPEMIKKVTEARELSDNLGTKLGGREWNIGTRYHFADTYGVFLDRKVFTPRIYPATSNGQLDGTPVFFTEDQWNEKKRKQPSQVPAQMLQNPLAGKDQMFLAEWLKPYWCRPQSLNVYIIGDPSKGAAPSRRTDNTAIAVIGVDANDNKYLLDGYRHRMSLSQRWQCLKMLYSKWIKAPGVRLVKVGWEQYGLVTDIEHFEEKMRQKGEPEFAIAELNWPRDHSESKKDRVERLVPDVQFSHFYIPAVVRLQAGKTHFWTYQESEKRIVYVELEGTPRVWQHMRSIQQGFRCAQPIVRTNEDQEIYDLTCNWIEEILFFPFGTRDDLADVSSRLYDMDPTPPMIVTEEDTEPKVYTDT